MEFEQAMERTFMPYIRTQSEIFDAGGRLSALPGMGFSGANDTELGEDAPSPHIIPPQGATGNRIPTTTSEVRVDPQLVDPSLSNNGPDGPA